jgi:hypothetical protein
MERERNAAQSAGASERPEFVQGDRVRQQATDEFNRSEFTNSAQRYLEARDYFQKSRAAHAQAQSQRQAQVARDSAATAEAKAALEARLRQAESAWSRAKQQPSEVSLTQQPSYHRAMAEEEAAGRFRSRGDLEGAAVAYERALSYLERARRENAEAASRRDREEAARRAEATPPPPPPTTAPVTTSAPSRAQDEAAIRQVLATYERSLENKDIALFRQVKPNLSPAEEKRLLDAFKGMDSQQVEITIGSISIEGDSATVNVTRRDVIIVRGRPQDGRSHPQVFMLSKSGGSWVIVQIGQ